MPVVRRVRSPRRRPAPADPGRPNRPRTAARARSPCGGAVARQPHQPEAGRRADVEHVGRGRHLDVGAPRRPDRGRLEDRRDRRDGRLVPDEQHASGPAGRVLDAAEGGPRPRGDDGDDVADASRRAPTGTPVRAAPARPRGPPRRPPGAAGRRPPRPRGPCRCACGRARPRAARTTRRTTRPGGPASRRGGPPGPGEDQLEALVQERSVDPDVGDLGAAEPHPDEGGREPLDRAPPRPRRATNGSERRWW